MPYQYRNWELNPHPYISSSWSHPPFFLPHSLSLSFAWINGTEALSSGVPVSMRQQAPRIPTQSPLLVLGLCAPFPALSRADAVMELMQKEWWVSSETRSGFAQSSLRKALTMSGRTETVCGEATCEGWRPIVSSSWASWKQTADPQPQQLQILQPWLEPGPQPPGQLSCAYVFDPWKLCEKQ